MDPFGLAEGVFLWKEKQQQASGNCNFTKGFCHFSENGVCFSKRPARGGGGIEKRKQATGNYNFPKGFCHFSENGRRFKAPCTPHKTDQKNAPDQTKNAKNPREY